MAKQLWIPEVPKRPSKADMKALVKAKLEGLEFRQAERRRRKTAKAAPLNINIAPPKLFTDGG